MGISAPLDLPLFEGTGVSSLVPHPYPIAINGRPYLIDYSHDINGFRGQFFHHASIPALRASQDTSASFGEQSLNNQGLARYSQTSWHHGAGQTFLEHPDSDGFRFRSSKGIDPWTRGQLSLLADTATKRASVNTNLALAAVGNRLYLADGSEVYKTPDMTTWTPTNVAAGEAGSAVRSLTSDGYNVWAAVADGIHTSTRDAVVWTHLVNQPAALAFSLVAYVKGRLMAAAGPAIYNITAAGLPAAPTSLMTHANPDFAWVGFAEGQGFIYAAGFSGDKSTIYRTTILADATALGAPVVAGTLPDGEIVRSISAYLGYILLGTDKGVRFCVETSTGDLTLGPIIPTASPVRCFEGQDRFVWFGWANYDSSSTGLGRLDLQANITPTADVPTPAFASDLMATAQGDVLSVATFAGVRVFAVAAAGVFAETANRVAVGTLDPGLITYGIPDAKVAVYLDVRRQPLPAGATHKAYLIADSGAPVRVGTSTAAGSTYDTFPVGQIRGITFEIREELDRSTIDATQGPVLVGHTLRANPVPATGTEIVVPIVLSEWIVTDSDEMQWVDVAGEVANLEALRTSGNIVAYQELLQTFTVTVEDLVYLPHHENPEGEDHNALLVVTMKTVN